MVNGMNERAILASKISATVLIGMCEVILISFNKFSASIVLVVAAIILWLPIKDSKPLQWGRVALLALMFAMVLWNISTTEYRDCYGTEVKFLDQLQHIFDGFLYNVFGIPPCRGA
jgi:hypothetical protein